MQTSTTLEQRFVAPDMARAMRMLADEMGDEAVLLSSRRVAEGVEVIGLPSGGKPSSDDVNQLHSDRRRQDRRKNVRVVEVKKSAALPIDTERRRAVQPEEGIQSAASQLAARITGLTPAIDGADKLDDMSKELQQMKRLLAESITSSGSTDDFLPQPIQYVVMNRLTQMGLSLPVVKALLQTATGDTVETLWQDCKRRLHNVIPTIEQEVLQTGGVLAVVGPSGSGKTALIAKLVASQALEHDAKDVAIISFDQGNLNTLLRLAELTGVAIFVVDKNHSFEQRIVQCTPYRHVFIDTNNESLEVIRKSSMTIKELLVLSATGEKRYLQRVINEYRADATLGCAFSFFDYTESLGELLSLLITEQLALCYMSEGLLLPEYLLAPDKDKLIKRLIAEQITAHEVMIPTVNMPAEDASGAATG